MGKGNRELREKYKIFNMCRFEEDRARDAWRSEKNAEAATTTGTESSEQLGGVTLLKGLSYDNPAFNQGRFAAAIMEQKRNAKFEAHQKAAQESVEISKQQTADSSAQPEEAKKSEKEDY